MAYKYKSEHVSWSIFTDTSSEDIDNWVRCNDVGTEIAGGIDDIPDGIYEVNQRNFNTNRRITLDTKVLVWKGKVDIQSSKEAVAEFLNKTGDWHVFIEGVTFGKKITKLRKDNGDIETRRTLEFMLGS